MCDLWGDEPLNMESADKKDPLTFQTFLKSVFD